MTDRKTQFEAWQKSLGSITLLSEAEKLRAGVADPATASAETCWTHIWDKPLYANTFVQTGRSYYEALRPYMDGAWRFIGKDRAQFLIEHKSGRTANDFKAHGTIPEKVSEKPKIAGHRLLAIQNGAAFLRKKVEEHGEKAPFASLADRPLDRLVPDLKSELGRGWGHITILHMLTEFGLAVKPDVHLVRAVKALGLLPGLPETDAASLKNAVAIVDAVKALAPTILGRAATRADLRFIDKVLMEASRQGLFPRQREAV